MAPSYASQLDARNYVGNVIVLMGGVYFSIRQPDSGLVIEPAYNGLVNSVVINPTQIDIRRVSSTISNFSFKLVDQNRAVTALIEGDAASYLDTDVEIWVGRSDVGMDFSEYYKLPTTRLKKLDYSDGVYSFQTQEQTERLNRALFQTATTLDVDILAGTTSIDVASVVDFPDSGYFKLENEIISFTGRDLVEKRLTGCIRGEFGTTPAAHSSGQAIYLLQHTQANPLDLLMQLLISGSGGSSAYDTLIDGCGLSEDLVDVAGMLELRDSEFAAVSVEAYLYQINGLKWIEEEILTPLSLRFSVADGGKLTVKMMDRLTVIPAGREITHSTIKGSPKWAVDASRIVNRLEIQWDYSEALGKYLQTSNFQDADSVTKYGEKDKLSFKFKTLRSDMSGAEWVQAFATRTLRRLSTPTPEIQITTHIDKSTLGPVDRVRVTSSQIPDYDGTLDFSSQLEIVSRSINYMNGDVGFRLAFVTNTLHNLGFIAPSPFVLPFLSFKAGVYSWTRRNELSLRYFPGADTCRVGWKLQLWLTQKNGFNQASVVAPIGEATLFDSSVYEVVAIDGQTVTLDREIEQVITPGQVFVLRFPAYSLCSEDQKRFCFVGLNASNFPDEKQSYKITYST